MRMKHLNIRKGSSRLVFAVVLSLGLTGPSLTTLRAQEKADNTKANKGDQNPSTPTADRQKNNRPDVETTRQIRRAIVADKSLSTYAHNIKIITQDGKVTLRGPVRTDAEKQSVQLKAAEIAGAANVTSDVSIAPEQTRKQK